MSARKSSHGTIFLIVSNGSPLALIASSLRSTSKKPVCPMTRSLHPPMAHCGQRVRFVATWREEFFKVPIIDRRAQIGFGGGDVPVAVGSFLREILVARRLRAPTAAPIVPPLDTCHQTLQVVRINSGREVPRRHVR